MKEPSHKICDVDMFAVSSTEMTGLIAAAPDGSEGYDVYKEIMPYRADCRELPKHKKRGC